MVAVLFGGCEKNHFAFTFTAAPMPSAKFCFDNLTKGRPAESFKRRRPLWDVDGGACEGKKKRRLRLNLITSRLSRPFSAPASNIVNRGISKIAVWAKGRRLEKNLLRKAAIMNQVRTTLNTAKASASANVQQAARETPALRQVIVQKPRCFEGPLGPSPLGLSNYDALDLEDEMFDDELDEDGNFQVSRIYTDFNIMNPVIARDGDEYDYLDELDGIPHDLPDQQPPLLDEKLVDIMKEKERQREISFVQFLA